MWDKQSRRFDKDHQKDALRETIDQCIALGILTNFLTKRRAEIMDIYTAHYPSRPAAYARCAYGLRAAAISQSEMQHSEKRSAIIYYFKVTQDVESHVLSPLAFSKLRNFPFIEILISVCWDMRSSEL